MVLDATSTELIYASGLSDRPWQDVVDALRDRLGAIIAALSFRTLGEDMPRIGVQCFAGNGEALWTRYLADYADSPSFPYLTLDPDRIHALSSFLAGTPELARLRAELFVPLGVGESYAMSLSQGGMSVGYLIWTMAADRPLTAEDAAWLALVARPLAKALAGCHRTRIAELSSQLAADALGRLDMGVIAIDGQDRIVFSNDVAGRILAQCPDLGIRGGRLVFARPELAARLGCSLHRAQAAQVRSRDGGTIGLMMAPVERGHDELGPRVPSAPGALSPSGGPLRTDSGGADCRSVRPGPDGGAAGRAAVHGLVPARGRRGNGDYRKQRAHLFQVGLSKLGVSRQAELVRHILTSVAIFGRIRGD